MQTSPIKKVLLLGAAFNTNNMGVNALTASTVKCIARQFPEAEIFILDYAYEKATYEVRVGEGVKVVRLLNMRFSKKIYLTNNVAILMMVALLVRLIPFREARKKIVEKNPYLRHICTADIIVSLAAGDSFSDIYGLGRFIYIALPQLLVILMGGSIVHLPQTIGPFQKSLTRMMARNILSRARRIYSRDREGLDEVKALISTNGANEKTSFCYDMAFVLDTVKPGILDLGGYTVEEPGKGCLVGLNVSGLLYMGGYTQNNMFNLSLDYRQLVRTIIGHLIKKRKATVLLVPHVFGSQAHEESDSAVCEKIFSEMKVIYPGKVPFARGAYSESEIKYVIGLCDFFIGSRMHSCIAALSQGIPAISIAYSRKFKGVLESLGVPQLVADPRAMSQGEILTVIDNAFFERDALGQKLKARMPEVQTQVLGIFQEISELNVALPGKVGNRFYADN